MKIGIITIQKCNNFGADLQAFALQKKLQLMGYDAENIDYVFYKNPRHLKGKDEKPVLRLSLVNRLKETLFPLLERVRNFRNRRAMSARAAKFDVWFAAHVRQSPEYRSVASLYAARHDYDVYMVGSDQVWNPRMGSNIKPYFLDFAPAGARCVSYASSIGAAEISAGAFYKFKQLLRRFSAIGVREKGAADIVGAMSLGVEVKHVVDPTLLLTADEWAAVGEKVDIEKKYLLLYDLIASEETAELARKIAAEKGISVIRVGDGAYGPGEFVSLFANASFVVTNSFHGTAFSLIHEKDFYSVIPRGMTNAARIESVLKLVGASSRLIRAEDVAQFADATPVDWASVSAKLDAARADSVDFLKRAVEGSDRKVSPKLPLGCYAVWNADDAVRAASTSGGLFRILAEDTIRQGGIVYGAAFAPDFHSVAHQAAETIEALDPLMKSKYVWSDPTAAYKEAVEQLKAGRRVLFTGTPCQIAAIKALARGCDENLLTIDIVCHGTPRPEIFAAYASELEARFGGKITKYEFRNKDAGWNFPRVNCEFSQGGGYNMILRNDPYYLAYGLNYSLRRGCFNCPFVGVERVGDFTIADCWRIASSRPEWDDNRGTSLVLVNTPKAQAIWDRIQVAGRVKGGVYNIDLAQLRNMPLQQRPQKPKNYEEFNKIFDETGSLEEAAKVFYTLKIRIRTIIVYWVKKLGWFYFRKHQ